MNAFDLGIIHFVNQYAGIWHAFDTLAVGWAYNDLLKAGPLLIVIFGLWFQLGDDTAMEERRLALIGMLAAACFAAATSVILTHILPDRPRPLIHPDVDFVLPYGMERTGWDRISSMPSDHAAMYFALAGGVWFASRFWGVLTLIYCILFVAFVRLYIGLHFPSDLLAGAAIGLGFAWLAQQNFIRTRVWQPILHWEAKKPHIFYPPMLLLVIIIGDIFHDARAALHLLTTTLPHG